MSQDLRKWGYACMFSRADMDHMVSDIAPANIFLEDSQRVSLCNQVYRGKCYEPNNSSLMVTPTIRIHEFMALIPTVRLLNFHHISPKINWSYGGFPLILL